MVDKAEYNGVVHCYGQTPAMAEFCNSVVL